MSVVSCPSADYLFNLGRVDALTNQLSFSYSTRSSIAIRAIGPQTTANRFDQRSMSPQFEQPSSTSTVALSTASLSTSTTITIV